MNVKVHKVYGMHDPILKIYFTQFHANSKEVINLSDDDGIIWHYIVASLPVIY